MSSTVSRSFNSVPARSASATWNAIVNLLAPSAGGARTELESVLGIVCSLITDKAMTSPIIVTGSGPRVRIYCLYDDDAIEGDSAAETALSFNATSGDWAMSLPCNNEDLSWVQDALKTHSVRITARDKDNGISLGEDSTQDSTAKSVALFNQEAFLRR